MHILQARAFHIPQTQRSRFLQPAGTQLNTLLDHHRPPTGDDRSAVAEIG